MELNAFLIFNSVIVVIWTVNPMPKLIEQKRFDLIALGLLAILLIDAWLYAQTHDLMSSLIAGLMIASLSLAGGYIMHRFSDDWRNSPED